MEEQIILRVPPQWAEDMRKFARDETPVPVTFDMNKKRGRRGVFRFGDAWEAPCTLVDLPCIIESQKQFGDDKTYYKSADIAQMLVVHNPEHGELLAQLMKEYKEDKKAAQVAAAAASGDGSGGVDLIRPPPPRKQNARLRLLKKEHPDVGALVPPYEHMSGLTPPTHNIRKLWNAFDPPIAEVDENDARQDMLQHESLLVNMRHPEPMEIFELATLTIDVEDPAEAAAAAAAAAAGGASTAAAGTAAGVLSGGTAMDLGDDDDSDDDSDDSDSSDSSDSSDDDGSMKLVLPTTGVSSAGAAGAAAAAAAAAGAAAAGGGSMSIDLSALMAASVPSSEAAAASSSSSAAASSSLARQPPSQQQPAPLSISSLLAGGGIPGGGSAGAGMELSGALQAAFAPPSLIRSLSDTSTGSAPGAAAAAAAAAAAVVAAAATTSSSSPPRAATTTAASSSSSSSSSPAADDAAATAATTAAAASAAARVAALQREKDALSQTVTRLEAQLAANSNPLKHRKLTASLNKAVTERAQKQSELASLQQQQQQ